MPNLPNLRKPSRRTLVVAGVVVVVVAAGLVWWLRRPDTATAQTITETVAKQSFKQSVSATGTIAPAAQADLSFSVSGTVTAVNVAAGDTVTAGQVLATVDPTLLQSAVTAKQSSLTAAKAKLSEDAGSSSAQLAADKAAVASAETQLAQAQADLDSASLKATISGTVAAVDVAVGDVVGSGGGSGGSGGSGSSSAAITIVSPKTFVVNANVSTSEISGVTAGLQAQITATGSTKTVYGTVSSVGKVASAQSNGAATFPVVIAVTGEQDDLYAGTSATVSIIVKQVDDVLAVSAQALHQDGDTTYVYKMVDGKPVKTTVTIGTTYGRLTQITQGLAEGDKVQLATFTAPTGGTGSTTNRNRTGTGNGGQTGGFGGGGFTPPTGGGFGGGGFGGNQ